MNQAAAREDESVQEQYTASIGGIQHPYLSSASHDEHFLSDVDEEGRNHGNHVENVKGGKKRNRQSVCTSRSDDEVLPWRRAATTAERTVDLDFCFSNCSEQTLHADVEDEENICDIKHWVHGEFQGHKFIPSGYTHTVSLEPLRDLKITKEQYHWFSKEEAQICLKNKKVWDIGDSYMRKK